MIKINTIKPNPDNPRKIDAAQLELLKKSITEFSKMMVLRPIIIDESGTVLGGNMRLEAIKALGMKEIPKEWVKRADDLSEAEKREFIIKDNAGFGDWDIELLESDWSDLPLADWGLDIPGFDLADEGETIEESAAKVTLADRFLIPPFSVLDARQGYWQDRKRAWLAVGIQSELGRGGDIGGNDPKVRQQNLSPGGSPRPAMQLVNGKTVRGDGYGNEIKS
jgi:ParB-like chromosome segregation protein Spo0J